MTEQRSRVITRRVIASPPLPVIARNPDFIGVTKQSHT
jgi:hypothetical protein